MGSDLLWPLCQSCARPMIREEDFGTNADRTKNTDFCSTCYRDGRFTEHFLTPDDMRERITRQMIDTIGMPPSRADEITRSILPTLKRWKQEIR
ncbi:MAG: zinc ribbon domain-containing protein [Methanomicrobiales archaeon]|nr:zinc ribbon domain-containing protein [Methanomicrobiales archaeon]